MRCSCYKVLVDDPSQFEDNHYQKTGTNLETVKKQRTSNEKSIIDRMGSSNMKKGSRNEGASKKTSDGRDGKRKAVDMNRPEFNHSRSKKARTQKTRCDHIVRLLMTGIDGRYYLRSNTCLEHKFHTAEPPESNQLNESDLKPRDKVWVEEMYNSGISNGHIANTMTGVFGREGKTGEFSTSTIKGLTQKWSKEIEAIKGISQKFSVAEKTIAVLNE